MKGGIGKSTVFVRPAFCGAIGIAALSAVPVMAQETGGVILRFGLEQRLETGTNLTLSNPATGDGSSASTTFSFGLSSETPAESIALTGDTLFRVWDIEDIGNDAELGETNVALTYGREAANGTFGITATLLESDLTFLAPLDTLLDGEGGLILPAEFGTTDEGRSQFLTYGVALETGLQDQIGYVFGLSGELTNYTDTTDADLVDSESTLATTGVILRFTPRTSARVDVSAEWFTEDSLEETDRLTTTVALGFEHELTDITTITGSIGYQVEETDEIIEGLMVNTRDEDIVGALGYVLDLPNGEFTATLTSETSAAGRINVLTFGRSLEIPDGTLAATFGVTDAEMGNWEFAGSVAYAQQFGPSDLLVSLARTVEPDEDDFFRATNTISAGYIYNIDQRSRIGLSIAYAELESTPAEGNVQRTDVSLAYDRALNIDWTLSSGILYQTIDEEDVGFADATTLFVALRRDFIFRP